MTRPDWLDDLLGRGCDWTPVGHGESGDRVFRSGDGRAYAKLAGKGMAALAGERDRLIWLADHTSDTPNVLDWREKDGIACLVMSAVPGAPACDLPPGDLLVAWPSIVRRIGALHALPAASCPFDRGLAVMYERARDVVAHGAVNPNFLPPEDQTKPPADLLARLTPDLDTRLAQESMESVICHGDPCLPNLMVDPQTLRCSGLIDLGRLGTADRYADLALLLASADEAWTAAQAERAFAQLFETLFIEAPDRGRLAFYLRLDPLTWG